MVLDPIPQSLPIHFFGSRPQPPTSPSGSFSRLLIWKEPRTLTNQNFDFHSDEHFESLLFGNGLYVFWLIDCVWHDSYVHMCDMTQLCDMPTLVRERTRSNLHLSAQHTATHCITLQHAATCCYALHPAPLRNTRCAPMSRSGDQKMSLTALHCSLLQHNATLGNILQHTAHALQHTATHCVQTCSSGPCVLAI